jgi:hypothetical protein
MVEAFGIGAIAEGARLDGWSVIAVDAGMNTCEEGLRQPAMCLSHHLRGGQLPINHLLQAPTIAPRWERLGPRGGAGGRAVGPSKAP